MFRATHPSATNPDLIPALAEPDTLASRSRAALLEGARTALGWRTDAGQRQAGLQRFVRREQLRTAAADILGLHDADAVVVTAGRATALAEVVLEAALT